MIEKNADEKQKKRNFTKYNTLNLTMEEYVKKAGKTRFPEEHQIQYNDKENWDKTFEAFLKNDGKIKALFLDFDGTMARFTGTAAETLAVHGFLSTVDELVDKGYKVAIITGRAMEGDGGILPALKRSGADDELLNKLEIFASHGTQQRGSDTGWEVKETQEVAEIIERVKENYGKQNEQLRTVLEQCIHDNKVLQGLAIKFDPKKPVGYTIHYREVEGVDHRRVEEELEGILAEIIPEEKAQRNFNRMKDEMYQAFTYRSATKSFEILLNDETTGIDLSKGTIVRIFAEKWNVGVGIAFGDDKTDLKMQKWLKKLADAGKLFQAFVGISHATSPKELITGSTIVVEGQERSVGLLAEMAREAEYQTAAPSA